MLDIPGIITGAAAGKGRGREILSMVRNADLILILVDLGIVYRNIELQLKNPQRLVLKLPDMYLSNYNQGSLDFVQMVMQDPL